MDSARIQLARRVLETSAHGDPVSFDDAIQLRNWTVRPEDGLLPLAEIARAILGQKENWQRERGRGLLKASADDFPMAVTLAHIPLTELEPVPRE
jgi:hypothetical protein